VGDSWEGTKKKPVGMLRGKFSQFKTPRQGLFRSQGSGGGGSPSSIQGKNHESEGWAINLSVGRQTGSIMPTAEYSSEYWMLGVWTSGD